MLPTAGQRSQLTLRSKHSNTPEEGEERKNSNQKFFVLLDDEQGTCSRILLGLTVLKPAMGVMCCKPKLWEVDTLKALCCMAMRSLALTGAASALVCSFRGAMLVSAYSVPECNSLA